MTLEELQAQVKKLSLRATEAKMSLHDLSEELPTDWDKIPDIAGKTYIAFKDLHEARKALALAVKAGEAV